MGSVALGDFRPGASDIDFVAVVRERPDRAALKSLSAAHREVRSRRRRPFFDGVVLTWNDLSHDPESIPPAPFAYEGRFHAAGRFALDPVTWHELANQGIAVRGPEASSVPVWRDTEALRVWTRNNLDTYWRTWLRRHERLVSLEGTIALTGRSVAWGVLGVARLRYTLATGDITSKAGAGEYALKTFGEPWSRILREALRIRAGPPSHSIYRTPLGRRRDALAFVAMAIETAADGRA